MKLPAKYQMALQLDPNVNRTVDQSKFYKHLTGFRYNFLMFTQRVPLFLTLVLLTSVFITSMGFAAKPPPSPDFDDSKTGTEKNEGKIDDRTRDLIDISPAPPPRPNEALQRREYFYPYRRAITLRGGEIRSSVERNGTKTPKMTGIQVLYTTLEQESYEASADLLTDGSGVLQFGPRYIFSRSEFRPYASVSGRILVNPADGLALFVNFASFQVAGAAGIEYLVHEAQSLRLQGEVAIGTTTMHIIASLGYVWAW